MLAVWSKDFLIGCLDPEKKPSRQLPVFYKAELATLRIQFPSIRPGPLYSPWLKFSTFKRLSWLWRYRARIFKCVVLWCRFQTKIQTNLTQGVYFKVVVCNSERAILLPSPSSHQSKKKKRKPSSLSQRILFPLEGQRKHFSSLSLGLDLELAFMNPPHTYLLLKSPKAKTEPEVCRPQTKGNLSIGSNQHSKFHPDVRHAGLGIYKIFRCYNRDDAGTRS